MGPNIKQVHIPTAIRAIYWKPDGTQILIGDFAGKLHLLSNELETILTTNTGFDHINMICWHPHLSMFAWSSTTWPGVNGATPFSFAVNIRDLEANTDFEIYHDDRIAILQMAWDRQGAKLALCGTDGTIRIYDIELGEETQTLSGHTDLINAVYWSDSHLIVSDIEACLTVWNPELAISERDIELQKHTRNVPWQYCAETGDLIFVHRDNDINVWHVPTKTLKHTFRSLGRVFGMHVDERGELLAIIERKRKRFRVLSLLSGKVLFDKHDVRHDSVAWSPDNRYVAVTSRTNTLYIWTATLDHIVAEVAIPENHFAITWSPSGDKLLVECRNDVMLIQNTPDISS